MNLTWRDRFAAGLFAILVAFHLLFLATFGRFPDIDDIFFKSAGRQWAATGQFASHELSGFGNFSIPQERVFTAYPPLYSILFGGVVKGFGFGWRTVFLYDAVLRALLACTAVWAARRIAPDAARWRAYAAGIAVLPLGSVGRPDDLAMCLGISACVLGLSANLTRTRAAISGGLLGACCATSLGAAFAFACIWSTLRIPVLRTPGRRAELVNIALATLAGVASLFVCLLPVLLVDPLAYADFSRLVRSTAAGAPFFQAWIASMRQLKLFYVEIAMFVILAGALLTLLLRQRQRPLPGGLWALLGGLLALGWMLYLARGKYPYLWFILPWIIVSVLAICGSGQLIVSPRVRRALTSVSIFAVLLGWLPYLYMVAVRLSLPREQSIAYSVEHLRRVIPAGATATGVMAWIALGDRNLVLDPVFSSPETISRVHYVISDSNGTGRPGLAVPFPDAYREQFRAAHFRVLENRLPEQPYTLFGRRVSNGAYGFGTIIYVCDAADAVNAAPVPATGFLPASRR